VSVTAKVAAYYRQFSDIPFAREVAERIGADAAFDQILREHGLERDKLTFYAPMRYVEIDLPRVVAAKLELLEEVRQHHAISPSPHHVVTAADALDFDEVRSSTAALDRGRPLTVLSEALIMYLSKEQTEQLATNIRRLLGEFAGGCWITPDFMFKAETRDLPPERVRLRAAITGVTQRQIDASAFEDGQDLAAFLDRAGFDVQVRSQVDETPAFSSIQALGLPPATIERLRGTLRLWVAQAKPAYRGAA
jgi:O-methyltransferase involved in polyketide biosynthesis